MRVNVAEQITSGRVRGGEYATTDADGLQGAFFIPCPGTGRTLRIIASDGRDWVEAGLQPPAWEHVSVSLASHPDKCPSWPEMAFVKALWWEPTEAVVEFHVPANDHRNLHKGCLHLWRPIGIEIPRPPGETVA